MQTTTTYSLNQSHIRRIENHDEMAEGTDVGFVYGKTTKLTEFNWIEAARITASVLVSWTWVSLKWLHPKLPQTTQSVVPDRLSPDPADQPTYVIPVQQFLINTVT